MEYTKEEIRAMLERIRSYMLSIMDEYDYSRIEYINETFDNEGNYLR